MPDDLAHLRDEFERQLRAKFPSHDVRVDLVEDGADTVITASVDKHIAIKQTSLPVAHIVAQTPWWRRLWAWVWGLDIKRYCSRCNARLYYKDEDREHEDECYWCRELEDAARWARNVVDEDEIRLASESLDELGMEQRWRHRRPPAPTEMPGLGDRVSK